MWTTRASSSSNGTMAQRHTLNQVGGSRTWTVPKRRHSCTATQGFGQLFPTRLELPNAKTQKVEVINSGFKFPRREHCPQSMYDAQMAHFVDCIRRNKTPIPGAMEGLVNMKVVDAAYKSSKIGKVVSIG